MLNVLHQFFLAIWGITCWVKEIKVLHCAEKKLQIYEPFFYSLTWNYTGMSGTKIDEIHK